MLNLDGTMPRPGTLIHFADLPGERRAVVLVHGAGLDHEMFAEQGLALHAKGHRVVVLDLRAHGASALDAGERFTAEAALGDVAALLDLLGLRKPVIVGHSLGGNLAQALVRRDPGRLGGLVVVDSTWNAGPLSAVERWLLRAAAPMLRTVPAARLPGIMARASSVTPAAIAAIEATFARMPKTTFLDVWRATASLVRPEPGYRTPVPLALLRGEQDRTGNIGAAMPRWAGAEGVPEHVIPRAGHVVTLDAPTAVSDTLVDLLSGGWADRTESGRSRA
ncbi:alpha/beta hydrolase fold protein [Beutenbergia cavernae DSM 12333]|uniref:Alpha/beta hydrolase fold protein n=1 Tax=Beutenbergia cavernae (strain ATCC BAA-8 / DSM 12333 / CCUG 43141 / JCM 11478 / NBRC 16432 / NCIMB 13614 / HKI 0122) TaxID=471853 RepID=C5C6I2_BEUC1|nr:alpha/beta hydrolase [Beutenbergia cavernae]ACQ80388.1 alpha/beta hydrolase fold protein [Beutenbergia cavernae DSM 12333]